MGSCLGAQDGVAPGAQGSNSCRGQVVQQAGTGVMDLSQLPTMGFSCLLEVGHPQPRSPWHHHGSRLGRAVAVGAFLQRQTNPPS